MVGQCSHHARLLLVRIMTWWIIGAVVVNVVSLAALIGLLVMVLISRKLNGRVRWALLVYLVANIGLIGVFVLAESVELVDPTDVNIGYLGAVLIDAYALATLAAFLLVLVITNQLSDLLAVLTRAGLVLWLLFQIPLWRGWLFTVQSPGLIGLDINRDYLAAYYAVLVALSYQAMTIWLAVRHRDQFPVPGLAMSIILLEIGYVLALLLPGVRELMVPNWFTLVAVAIIGCGLHRMSVPSPVLSVPAAQTDDG
jgi:hypothetical protein